MDARHGGQSVLTMPHCPHLPSQFSEHGDGREASKSLLGGGPLGGKFVIGEGGRSILCAGQRSKSEILVQIGLPYLTTIDHHMKETFYD